MPSTIGWLDTTAEQQRIAREMVALFMQQESRDELGIAQIRDVLSNWLFPGTSVLQARARYFVLVPWCYVVAERKARGRKDVDALARGIQQDMIETMRQAYPDENGLIGKQAGRELKGLPSSLFWSGLETFDIHLSDQHLTARSSRDEGEEGELVERALTKWDPDLPPVPDDFPTTVENGLNMSPEEATWLSERMRAGKRKDTYLAYLLETDPAAVERAPEPWDVPHSSVYPELDHARRFSYVMHGAALLYNLIVAERYSAHPELTRYDGSTLQEEYQEQIAEWAGRRIPANDPTQWDLETFQAEVSARNRRISHRTWTFVRGWIELVRTIGPDAIADSLDARALVVDAAPRHVHGLDGGGGIRFRIQPV